MKLGNNIEIDDALVALVAILSFFAFVIYNL
jgi:hypothetical protein